MRRRPRVSIARIMGIVAACGVAFAMARWPPIATAMIAFGVPISGIILTCLWFPPEQPVSSLTWEAVVGGCLGIVEGTVLGVVGLFVNATIYRQDDGGPLFVAWWVPIGGACGMGPVLGVATGTLMRLGQSLGRRGPVDRR